MKILLPPKRLRMRIERILYAFYDAGGFLNLDFALGLLSDFYEIPLPEIDWVTEVDGGLSLAKTLTNGHIMLIVPGKGWERHAYHESISPRDAWVHTLLHEWWHYMVWVNEEEKADEFAHKMLSLRKGEQL